MHRRKHPDWWTRANQLWWEEAKDEPFQKPKRGVYTRIAKAVGKTREAVIYALKPARRQQCAITIKRRRRQRPEVREQDRLYRKGYSLYGRVENWPDDIRREFLSTRSKHRPRPFNRHRTNATHGSRTLTEYADY